MANGSSGQSTPTYRTIADRLRKMFVPEIDLDAHIGGNLRVHTTTLDGVTFWPRNYEKLLDVLRNARTHSGDKAFEDGGLGETDHWAVKLSFGATEGTGFREIRHLSARPPSLADALPTEFQRGWRSRFSSRFVDSSLDLSSLHWGVNKVLCNVHIDDTGFVVTMPNGQVIVNPDAFQHLFNELVLKTYGKKYLSFVPSWVFDRMSILLPHSSNEFSGATEVGRSLRGPSDLLKLDTGLSVDLAKKADYHVTVKAVCSLPNCTKEWSGTITVGGRHDLLGGSR